MHARMRLDDVSAATVKAQTLLPSDSIPLQLCWDGGNAPMLVLHELRDVIATPEIGRSLRRDHSGRVTLVEFPELGHAMARERPDLVTNAITSWAAELGAR